MHNRDDLGRGVRVDESLGVDGAAPLLLDGDNVGAAS